MRLRRPSLPLGAVLWFGVLGAPFAWAAQHVAGYALTAAACGDAGRRWNVHLDTWTIVVTAVAATVTLLAGAAAVSVFRVTRDAGDEPPGGRIHFLAIVGMTITPLFLAIIVMSGLGSILLANCVQG